MNSSTIWFEYNKNGKAIRLTSEMPGLSGALNAAATNPYGTAEKVKEKPKGKARKNKSKTRFSLKR